jgi:hypothetical protein
MHSIIFDYLLRGGTLSIYEGFELLDPKSFQNQSSSSIGWVKKALIRIMMANATYFSKIQLANGTMP